MRAGKILNGMGARGKERKEEEENGNAMENWG